MKHVRIIILIILLVAFSTVYLTLAADYKYVGSSKSDKYHYPSCQWAKKIKPDNLVTFKSAKEAQDAGYVPCKVCKPPIKD
jgi:micrococcal nuclease